MQDKLFIRDLGDGLILRHASKRDANALADFNSRIHSDGGWDQPDSRIAVWTRDLLTKPHPTLTPYDITIVEEVATGRIVSSLDLIPQTWTYQGIPFGVGRPELVGTLPEFRKHGLVHIQFEEFHRWCEQRELVVQAITGIPYFYRQFGYEMALELSGRRFGFEPNVPKLKKGEKEKFHIRHAVKADLPFIVKTYAESQKRYTISCVRSMDVFAYELKVQSRENINKFELHVIEDEHRRRVGYFQLADIHGMDGLLAVGYELRSNTSWLEVTPSVARYLWKKGKKSTRRDGYHRNAYGFMLGTEHPAYNALGDALPWIRPPYAWYLRVPDLPGFIRLITPALEQRLADSIAISFTGSLKISFYRDGLQMVFSRGRLKSVETWKPSPGDSENAAFSDLTFLQLLFGYRSFDELRFAFKDIYAVDNTSRVVLKALFPKRLSDIFAIY